MGFISVLFDVPNQSAENQAENGRSDEKIRKRDSPSYGYQHLRDFMMGMNVQIVLSDTWGVYSYRPLLRGS